ncbi:DUF2512 family protein [Paenibacillus yanchengensis]|uniref:DUF2512 family protein n=1 Tax=Paenibacillus yanchengensis TaxID=2035833 RepID=A0ABW4YFZ1_9BACL
MIKFLLKWLVNVAVIITTLIYYLNMSFLNAFITATVITIISYVIGDQIILRVTNNVVAALLDAVLCFIILFTASFILQWHLSLLTAIYISLLIGVVEWLLHRYIFNNKITL